MSNVPHRNLSLRDAIRIARDLGCELYQARGDELGFAHSAWPQRMRVSTNRHDCPRKLLSMLHGLRRIQGLHNGRR